MTAKKVNMGFKLKILKLPKSIRIVTIVILTLLFVFSTYSIYAAYQEPTTTEESYPAVNYSSTGRFNYIVYLKNNTVYNKTQLKPGEGKIFKQILESINLSFIYSLNVDTNADIYTTYSMQAAINTDLWTKKYNLIDFTELTNTGKSINFNESLEINYSYYEKIWVQINEETGLTATNPSLEITCNIYTTATTNEGDLSTSLSPTISFSLAGKTIEVSEDLSQTKTGSINKLNIISHPEVIDQRNNSLFLMILFLILLIVFFVFTKNKIETISEFKRMINRIRKKYGEWMVESSSNPLDPTMKIIQVKTMDDLSKVGEELGKPIISYNKGADRHEFYVVDNSVSYKYELKSDEKIRKIAICPQCKHEIPIEGYPGSQIEVICNKCGKKGVIFLGEDGQKKSLSDYFNKLFKRNF